MDDITRMQWHTPSASHSEGARKIVEWVNANGGEARYQTEKRLPVLRACIRITGPNGPVYVSPGDTVTMGKWFDSRGRRIKTDLLREFTVEDR